MTKEEQENKAKETYEKKHGKPPLEASGEEKEVEYERLKKIAEDRGIKPGWAYYEYKRTFNEDPPKDVKTEVEKAKEILGIKEKHPHGDVIIKSYEKKVKEILKALKTLLT